MRSICILLVCLTTCIIPWTLSAQPYRALFMIGITTAYSWAWWCRTHCYVILHGFELVDNLLQAGRCSYDWRIWFHGVQLNFNAMYTCLGEALGVFVSYWTRIAVWSNPRFNWTDALAFMCIWELLEAQTQIWKNLEAPATSPGALMPNPGAPACTSKKPGSSDDKLGRADDMPGSANMKPGRTEDKTGSADDMPGSTPNYGIAVRETHHLVWDCCWCTRTS